MIETTAMQPGPEGPFACKTAVLNFQYRFSHRWIRLSPALIRLNFESFPRGMGTHDGLHGPHGHFGQILFGLGSNFRFGHEGWSNQENGDGEDREEKGREEGRGIKSRKPREEEDRNQDRETRKVSQTLRMVPRMPAVEPMFAVSTRVDLN